MDEKQTLFASLCRDPMLFAEAGRITYCNEALRSLLPELKPGAPAEELLPETLLNSESERIAAPAELAGRKYAALAQRVGESGLAVAFTPSDAARGAFLSDGAIAELKIQLFNMELAVQRINEDLPEGPGFEDSREYLAILRRGCSTTARQIANMETAIKLQEGVGFLNPEKTDLVHLCDSLVATVGILTGENCASVEFETDLDVLPALVDSVRVERLLLNLLSNSLKFTPPDGHIRVALSRAGENAVISVDDTGSGISADVMQNVFARYDQRFDPDCPDPVGAGLGLTVARGIAEAHGGALVLESREGHGTSARVSLPLDRRAVVLECRRTLPSRSGIGLIIAELASVLDREFFDPDYT